MTVSPTNDPGYYNEPEDEEETFYCPHGNEVATSGGACYWCAQEDAFDDDY
jgi:hypothetical protein